MPNSTPVSPPDSRGLPRPRSSQRRTPGRSLTPDELVAWIETHREGMADRWLLELRSRVEDLDESEETLLREFLDLLVRFLPETLGTFKDQVSPLYHQAAELYGHLAAIRGLAAGEAVEEVQLLREVILRFLYRHPPGAGQGLGLRELLQLSRLVDQAVTHTSVGHTDTLFFNLFHGNGVPESAGPEILAEVRDQLQSLRDELDRLQALEEGGVIPSR